jgi:hypothetical protein
VASRLTVERMTQAEAAEALGISQSSVAEVWRRACRAEPRLAGLLPDRREGLGRTVQLSQIDLTLE